MQKITFHPSEIAPQVLRDRCKKLKKKSPVQRKDEVSAESKESRTYVGSKKQNTPFGWKYSQGIEVCAVSDKFEGLCFRSNYVSGTGNNISGITSKKDICLSKAT